MTAEELVYDILEIKNALEDDNDVDPLWLLNKINMYRSSFIAQYYAINNEILPAWQQRIRKQKVKRVTAADDPTITNSSVVLGKVTLPKIVSLPGDVGFIRLTGSGGILSFDQIDFDTLMLKVYFKEERMGEFGWFSRVGEDVFMFPLLREVQAIIIPENPMDIQVIDPITNSLRQMEITDEYPIDMDIAQKIVYEILTKDLQINMQSISDVVNDSQSQLKILQNANGTTQSSG
jgi:hypothetical protein